MENVEIITNIDRLRKIFHFSDKDLEENRLGKISTSQKIRIRQGGIIVLSLFGIMGLVFSLPLIWDYPEPINQARIFVSIGIFLLFILLGVKLSYSNWVTIIKGNVQKLHGKVTFKMGKYLLFLYVDDECIKIIQKVEDLFDPNVIYSIYYSSSLKMILSIEKE